MAAPVPVALIPLYSSFRVIVLNLKNLTDVENSFKKLVLLNFNVTMSKDFNLKNILKRTPVDEDLEELKNMVLAKVEKLENRIAEAKEIMEEETPKDEDSGSSSDDETSDEEVSKDTDSDSSSDDEESPSKKPCTTSGPIKPTAQKAFCEGLAASETVLMLPKLTIKVPNPFAKKSTQPLVPVFGKPQKASPPSATGQTIDEYLEKRRVERNEEKKENAKVFKLDDPCMKRPKYKIPRKPVSFQPTNSAKAHEEEPNWPPFEKLKDRVLAKIEELEAAYEQKTEKAEEKVSPEALKTSRFEKKPRKRPAESHGSMEPPAKRSMGSKDESSRKSDDWIPKKRLAPSQVAQPQKTASTPPPAAPIITSSSSMGFRIPKKKAIAPSSAPEVVMVQSTEPARKPLPPTVSVPVPLLSLVLEKPTWLGEQVLRRIPKIADSLEKKQKKRHKNLLRYETRDTPPLMRL
ncbi:unnamed protein product [Caenorhabditis brenneri]